jgi:DNA replication licensing factor MCM7
MPPKRKQIPVRKIGAEHIGKLIQMQGIVTRASEVKPHVAVAAYTCEKCGAEVFQEVCAAQFVSQLIRADFNTRILACV